MITVILGQDIKYLTHGAQYIQYKYFMFLRLKYFYCLVFDIRSTSLGIWFHCRFYDQGDQVCVCVQVIRSVCVLGH